MRASASRGDLITKCQYPLHEDSVEVQSDSPAAKMGRAVHDLIAFKLNLGNMGDDVYPEGSNEALELRRRAEAAANWANVMSDGCVDRGGEVTLYLDSNYRVHLEDAEGRTRVTPDFWWVHKHMRGEYAEGETRLFVVDWKTGQRTGIAPEKSLQLGLQGYAVWRWLMPQIVIHSIEVAYGYIDNAGKIYYDGSEPRHPMELRELLNEYQDILGSGGGDPNPGRWCKDLYCPCITTCPAADQATEHLVPVAALTGRQVASTGIDLETAFNITSDAQCEKALNSLAIGKRRVDELEKAIKCYAAERGEVHLSDGKRYRQVVSNRSSFNKAKAFEAYPELSDAKFQTTTEVVSWKVTK